MFIQIKKHSKTICYILAFIIPVIFMLIISNSLHFYPFGDVSPLVADTDVQFSSYIAYLKTVFYGNNDMFYTFSKTIGGDMAGFACYYLANPLLYILVLVPNEMLPAGILFIIILMMALSSLNFNIMLNNVFGFRWSSLLFSISYAFMGYFTGYYNFIIYFFNVMLLPLIILGIYEIVVKEKKSFKYVIFLAISIIVNYYIGYMTCIFCLLFFIYLCVINKSDLRNFKQYAFVVINFVVSSILALMLSAVALFTVVFSLQGQKITKGSGIPFPLGINFHMRDVFAGLYTASFNGNISDGLPIIYVGTLAVVFLFLYFMNKEIKLKEKIASGVFLLLMLLFFYIKFLNVMWHGFAEPVGFPYRNSFFLSFLMLFVSYKGFILMKKGTRKYHTLIVFSVYFLYSIYLFFTKNAYAGIMQIILTGSFLTMILAGVYAICYKREYMYPITIGFFLIVSFDLLQNGYYSISRYYGGMENVDENRKIEFYQQYYNDNRDILDYIEKNGGDSNFYRVDKMYRYSHNDPMLLGYSGLSHFSSTEKTDVKNFMESFGFPTNSMWSYYGVEGNTAFMDSVLGLKYMVSQFDETCKPYSRMTSIHDKYIYKNPYSLGLSFAATENICEADLTDFNVFTRQNELAKLITGEPYGLYRPVEIVDIKYENVEKYEKSLTKLDPSKEAYVEFDLFITSNDFIYGNFTSTEQQNTTFTVNELEKEPYFTYYNRGVRCIGFFDENTVVPVRIYLNQDQIEIDSYEFYYESKEELERFYENATMSDVKTKEITSSHLVVNADIDEKKSELVFSMPYDEGWKITVDGAEVKEKKVLSTLLAVDITPGKHTIELKYTPRGLKAGAIISVIGLIILIGLYVWEEIRIRKLIFNKEQSIFNWSKDSIS